MKLFRKFSTLHPPLKQTLVAKLKRPTTIKEREEILQKTEYNVFSFPAMFCVVDFLSDSGTSAMYDTQWSQMVLGDESYGRNDGYYVLLEALRDTFERKNKQYSYQMLTHPNENPNTLLKELILKKGEEGGFFNGSTDQLIRPNSFLVPQGRCAEFLLFSTVAEVMKGRKLFVPSNGFFDTTRGNCMNYGIEPIDIFHDDLLKPFDISKIETENPFRGDLDVEKLYHTIQKYGPDNIPFVMLTCTNNSAAGQPVSMKNIKEVKDLTSKFGIPLWMDACRFAENAYFIKHYEKGYSRKSDDMIIKEMMKHVDGFHISFKKDGLANMGGGLFFRDQGLFHQRFSKVKDVGLILKEKQILTFGNDSYGGMSGRDIMALCRGLYEVTKDSYLQSRTHQSQDLAMGLAKKGIPVIVPPGAHAVYIDVNKFFPERKWSDFAGVGLTIELLRKYAIRGCELGAFAFEFDQRESLPDPIPPNLVRFAIPRNVYGPEHIDYTIEALGELYEKREEIPNVVIVRGQELKLRHFQSGLKPVYKESGSWK